MRIGAQRAPKNCIWTDVVIKHRPDRGRACLDDANASSAKVSTEHLESRLEVIQGRADIMGNWVYLHLNYFLVCFVKRT